MKKNVMWGLLLCMLFAALVLTGCKEGDGTQANKKQVLTIWSFTNEFEKPIERFKEKFPGVEVNLVIVPSDEYLNKIRPVMKSGKNAPDLFTAESAYVKDIVDSNFWDDLYKAPYNADVSDLVPYQVEMATDSQGALKGISWQTTPGGFYFRRSLALKYLGTDDPYEIGKMLSTTEKFLDVARMLYRKSNGKVKIITSNGDFMRFSLSMRKNGFVTGDNRFNIDPAVLDFFEVSKILRDEQLTAETSPWSPGWFEEMKKTEPTVFGFVLPTWGLHYVLKQNAPETSGDWGLTGGPASYFWGGTWMGVYSKSKNKELAWEFIKMMTLDEETLEWWAKDTGDFLGNETVFNKIKNDFSEPFLNGQNHYLFFAGEAPKCNGALVTKYDQQIEKSLLGAVVDYIEGIKTKDEAVTALKEEVKNIFPQLTVN